MIDGRRGESLAAVIASRVRWNATLLVFGAVATFVGHWWLDEESFLVVGALGLLWIVAVVDGGSAAWRARSAGLPALLAAAPALFAFPLFLILLGPLLYWARVSQSWVQLHRDRPAFEALTAGRSAALPGTRSVVRVAGATIFPTHNGMLGAWRAIVHDPSGRAAGARGWNGGPVDPDVRFVFGSELVWCQRLDGPWFHCQFE